MTNLPKLLLLDDDPIVLELLSRIAAEAGWSAYSCADEIQAREVLVELPQFAIVDLYLRGSTGSELSNDFIREELIPRGISYGRLTSAPHEVPEDCSGEWVWHKRILRTAPHQIEDFLHQRFAQMREGVDHER